MMRLIGILAIFVLLFSCNAKQERSANNYSRSELKKRTFDYFWETTHTSNFQIPDRYPTLTFSSIAATGFGLSAYLVGIENKYITRAQGAERVLNTLKTLWQLPQGPEPIGMGGHKGFFYHFLTIENPERYKQVELSSIDTGLLMAGVLSCMSYFDMENDPIEKEIRQVADALYRRVDWSWMMKSHGKMSMGWHPEKGFIESDTYAFSICIRKFEATFSETLFL